VAWPVGRRCPIGRMAEAWVAHRYGVAVAIEGGSGAAGARSAGIEKRLRRAIGLYEAFAGGRPRGWPEFGPAALCALASQERAGTLAGDISRLLILAKAMRATARLRDPARTQRASKRAEARSQVPQMPLRYRRAARTQETAEQRRRRVRDVVLLRGGDPAAWPNAEPALSHLKHDRGTAEVRVIGPVTYAELDGVGARAQRYRHELETGRWTLAGGWDAPDHSCPPTPGGAHA
jgi:hypothetical protein